MTFPPNKTSVRWFQDRASRTSRGQKRHAPKIDLAEQRRAVVEANFLKRGHAITVPNPVVSNTALKRLRSEKRGLFYRPSTVELGYESWMLGYESWMLGYESWMTSVGQGSHWTVTNHNDSAKVAWEPAMAGYWFTAEIALVCPRVKTSWNDLTGSIRLLSLEEYAIVYWTHRDLTGERIDVSTWCWLRTRFGQGALSAFDDVGKLSVKRRDALGLSISYSGEGGRAVEVVKAAA